MTGQANDAEAIFLAALDKATPQERAEYIEGACAADTELLHRVRELLDCHHASQGPLDVLPLGLGATIDSPLPSERPGTVIGPYKLLEQIGEGGFGVVFMAEQSQPVRRKVALKVLKPGMDTRQVIARFEAERQALAIMDHPNIAHVFDGGETAAGRPYFVMELVRGVPITDFCDQNHLPVRERLGLFVHVCQAVQHAHQKGIIHRDLKPMNILVTLHDDKPVVKVIDFGIAKATGQQLTEKTLFTNFAQMIGTPLYMSPEQAQMSGLDVDTRSDIYSLGVLLYELLTGTTPFDKERLRTAAYDEIRRIIREEEPPKPSTRMSTPGQAVLTMSTNRRSDPQRLRQLFRGELDWIVMKALEKDRNRRYETASNLAADVQRYLDDEPVLACPPSATYRFRKFTRRNKRAVVTVTAVALAVLLTVAVLATSTVLIAHTQRTTAKALQAETDANDGLQEALTRERETLKREQSDAYIHRIALAHRELSRDNLGRALEHLDKCPAELRQWEWHYLNRLCRVEPVVVRVKSEVNSVAFGRDGELIASAGGDGAIKVWNSKTGEMVQTLNTGADSVYGVVFHRDGKHLASLDSDRKVKVWDWTTGQTAFTASRPSDADHSRGTAYCLAFSPDGKRLAAGGSDGAVNVWDWKNDQLILTLKGHAKKGISVAFSPDGRRLASGSWSGHVMIWDAETGALLHTLSGHRHPVSALAFSPNGERLVSACFDRSLIVWDATAGQRHRTLVDAHDGLVLGVVFSHDGSRLASVGEDKTVRVWEADSGTEVLDLRGHTELCQCVACSPDGQRFASASLDGTIRVWDGTPLQGNEVQKADTFYQQTSEVWTMAVSRDGEKIASSGLGLGVDAPVKVWDARSGRLSVEFAGHQAIVFCLAWHPDGQRIATSGWDRERKLFVVKVWDARDARTVRAGFELPTFEIAAGIETYAFAFSPDGEHLVTGRANGKVQVWDAWTGREVGTLGTHDLKHVRGVVFSRDGRYLASASDGVVKLWDATRLGDEQKPLRIFHARIPLAAMTFAFDWDGRRLVAGGEKNTVKIWDVQTGQELQRLEGHSGDVWATAFSPDREGRWVASAGEDSTVKIWDSRTGALVRSFRGHTGLISSVTFSNDGKYLFSGSRDKTVKVWDLSQLEAVPDR
jgi:WD40 repeat protein/serine/threonine protein kinase